MSLPSLTLQTRVTASHAKHDKIEFILPLGTFRDIPTFLSLEEIADYLGAPPLGSRSSTNWDVAQMHSVYFNRPTGERRSSRRELTVRQLPIDGLSRLDPRFQTAPLCAGALILQAHGTGENRYVTAKYEANVNPTRFVRYQDLNVMRRSSYRPSGLPPLFRNTTIDTDEFSLDGSDNWLPDSSAAIWRSFVGLWPDRLADYFNNLETAMRGEINRRGEISSSDGTGTLTVETSDEPWPLERVETYWEFSQEASPEFLNAVEQAMRSYSALPFVREEFMGAQARQPRSGRQRESLNGTVLSVTSKPGTKLVVYAKTNRRVRLEVRHDLRNLAQRSPLPREAAGAAGMVETLQTFSEDAAEVVNAFLAHLERQQDSGLVPWSLPPTDLIFRLASRCHSREAARVIMGLLMTDGAVSRVEWLNNSIDALVRSRILERARNQQRRQAVTFVPAPAYQLALQRLRDIATADSLTRDRRQRTAAAQAFAQPTSANSQPAVATPQPVPRPRTVVRPQHAPRPRTVVRPEPAPRPRTVVWPNRTSS